MEKYTFSQIEKLMREFNQKENKTDKNGDTKLIAVVVFTEDSFDKHYTEKERSYKFTNNNYAFMSGKISNSIFGDCLDGQDLGVRLDYYIRGMWKVDYCYLLEGEK